MKAAAVFAEYMDSIVRIDCEELTTVPVTGEIVHLYFFHWICKMRHCTVEQGGLFRAICDIVFGV